MGCMTLVGLGGLDLGREVCALLSAVLIVKVIRTLICYFSFFLLSLFIAFFILAFLCIYIHIAVDTSL